MSHPKGTRRKMEVLSLSLCLVLNIIHVHSRGIPEEQLGPSTAVPQEQLGPATSAPREQLGLATPVPQEQLGPATFGNFRPQISSTFQIFGSSGEFLNGDRVDAGVNFFAKHLKVEQDQLRLSSFHTSQHNGVTHLYFRQILNGIPVNNGYGNINVLQNGQVHSLGSSIYIGPNPALTLYSEGYTAGDALGALADLLNLELPSNLGFLSVKNSRVQSTLITGVTFAEGPVQSELNYIQTESELRLVREINLDLLDNYYVACVDTETNKVLSLIDYFSEASYKVIPFGRNDPRESGQTLVEDPEDTEVASPHGWHYAGHHEHFQETVGNNVIAQDNTAGDDRYHNNTRPRGEGLGDTLVFRFAANFNQNATEYTPASTVQLFYMTNILHDVFYRYGFTEDAGNFQENNFGLGGDGSDAVLANTQDPKRKYNPAFFAPPDGSNGRMRQRVFNAPVSKDSSYDSAIVVHEYLHGVSVRLTGGRMNVQCLAVGEAQAMGEGWGDFFGMIFQSNETTNSNNAFYFATYVLQTDRDKGPGIRRYPYTVDMRTNPATYAYTIRQDYVKHVHDKGEVWATILNEAYWNLVEKHGFQKDWYKTNSSEVKGGKLGGNVIFAQLLIDGMKLQPCNPNFIHARDAIIEADWINNNGDNFDELWHGFARRGLGIRAVFPGQEDFTRPNKTARGGVSMNSAGFTLFTLSLFNVNQF